jgi:hypothetical protein
VVRNYVKAFEDEFETIQSNIISCLGDHFENFNLFWLSICQISFSYLNYGANNITDLITVITAELNRTTRQSSRDRFVNPQNARRPSWQHLFRIIIRTAAHPFHFNCLTLMFPEKKETTGVSTNLPLC